MVYGFYLLCALMVVIYALSTVWHYQAFFSPKHDGLIAARIYFGFGVIIQFSCLMLLGKWNHRYPFATGAEGLLFCSWLVAMIHVVVDILSPKRGGLGFFTVLPITLVVLLASFMIQPISDLPAQYRGALFSFHVVTSLSAYASFSVAAILAALHIILFRKLKAKSFDVFFRRLPPLDVLEKNSALWIMMGSVWMGIAAVIGHVWVASQTQVKGMSPAEWFIFLLLVCYVFALAARRFLSFRGVKFSYAVVCGFVYLVLTQVLSIHGFK